MKIRHFLVHPENYDACAEAVKLAQDRICPSEDLRICILTDPRMPVRDEEGNMALVNLSEPECKDQP